MSVSENLSMPTFTCLQEKRNNICQSETTASMIIVVLHLKGLKMLLDVKLNLTKQGFYNFCLINTSQVSGAEYVTSAPQILINQYQSSPQ